MKSTAYPLIAIAALFTTVAASSAQFSSPHVQDLAKDFDEKVRPKKRSGDVLNGKKALIGSSLAGG